MKQQQNNRFLHLFDTISDELKLEVLSHSSYANECHSKSNERLEYLGDGVLGLIVAEYLFTHSVEKEGNLSRMRSTLVCEKNLAMLAKELDVGKMLKVGKSFTNVQISDAMLADTIEAMIGGIFMHHGYSSIKTAILKLLKIQHYIDNGGKSTDYKSVMQEHAQHSKARLSYDCVTYVNKGGQTNFKCVLSLSNAPVGTGRGSSKREAEQNAASKAIDKLKIAK